MNYAFINKLDMEYFTKIYYITRNESIMKSGALRPPPFHRINCH